MKKPFDLQKALAGTPVVTRDGRKVTSLHEYPIIGSYPVMASIEGEDDVESFTRAGNFFRGLRPAESGFDLFLDVPVVTKTIYATVMRREECGTVRPLPNGLALGNINYSSPEEALRDNKGALSVATITYEVPE